MKTKSSKYAVIKYGSLYMDTYGPTVEEITWTENKKTCFHMTLEGADQRLETVRKFFPTAEVQHI